MASSAHFSDRELACHHCGVNGTTVELVGSLEQLRSLISIARGADSPIIVDDAYRCSVYNAKLPNAARHSEHVLGNAADIRVDGMTAADLYRFVVQVPQFKGVGRNDFDNYCHVDVRDEPARWCYDAHGFTIPWTDPPAADASMA